MNDRSRKLTLSRYKSNQLSIAPVLLAFFFTFSSCDTVDPPPAPVTVCSETLAKSEVESIIAHAVEQAQRLNQKVIVAISDLSIQPEQSAVLEDGDNLYCLRPS